MSNFFWLAPLFPLTVFALLALGLNRFGRAASLFAVIAMAAATPVSLSGLVGAATGDRLLYTLPWLSVGERTLTLALWLDPLSALSASLVSVVSLLVFIYAASYMADDPRCGRFFAIFSLFAGSMLMLVLAADIMLLFIAWELVGLCSYLLIGFWFERPNIPTAASKAFLITRLADLFLLAGILWLIGITGTGRIDLLLAAVTQGRIAGGLLLLIALLLFAGATGKSAQFPLQGWLPDAMAGPTPVSALLHSATMVAAGVFLVARFYPLFQVTPLSLSVVAWIGVITALLGGCAALVEPDLKRTLAYSTMSQIGLMFVGLGSGSLLAGVLLLIAQAFYKATLFLAAGAIDHAVSSTLFERMGGLWRRMPWTMLAFALAAAALAGLPVTLALPSKDPVLTAAWQTNMGMFLAALLASLLTALYSARAFGLVFLGQAAPKVQEAHEAKAGLLAPLLLIALLIPFVLLANAALLGSPLATLLKMSQPDVLPATILTLLIAVIGVVAGLGTRLLWPRSVVWPVLSPVRMLFNGEFGLRATYKGVTRATFWLVRLLGTFERVVFDALIGAIVQALLNLVKSSNQFDIRGVDATVRSFGHDLLAGSQRLRRLQTGRIENYLLLVFLWGIGVIAVALVILLR